MAKIQGRMNTGQESHRYTYSNGRAETHAKHQNTNHTPGLEHVRLDTTHHTHVQHLPPIPSATQPPHWIPGDTPCTDIDKQYHYPTQIQQLATTLGHPANTELLSRVEDSVCTPLYYSALRPPHLQNLRLQLALEQLPLLTRNYRWYARRSLPTPAGYTKCICGHTGDETWDHLKMCPLYRELDTLTDWNSTHNIVQHTRWPTRSPGTQKLATILRQIEVLEEARRGIFPTAVYTLVRTHVDDPEATAAHMQRMSVAQNGHATHVPHPEVPAACSNPTPRRTSPAPQTPVLPTVRPHPATYHPTQEPPPQAHAPSTAHDTDTARTSTTCDAHTPVSMRTPQDPMPQRHHPYTVTADRRPPRAPSVYANSYHRRPCPATQTTGSA